MFKIRKLRLCAYWNLQFKRWINIKILKLKILKIITKNPKGILFGGQILIVILMAYGMHIHIKPIDGFSPSS